MPSETLHRRDAVSELLHKSKDGFTACFRGHNNHELNRRHKKAHLSALFLACVAKSRLV